MCNTLLIISICILIIGTLYGFFKTKTEGFGRFATSTLLLIFVISISSLLYVGGKLEAQIMVNVLFAVIGFAGGLFASKNE